MEIVVDSLLVLVLGVAVAWGCRRIRVPAPVGQVLLGVVLGGAVLGLVEPNARLQLLGQVGVVLLLGMAGLELGLGSLKAAGWAGFWVAVLGIVLSGAAGFWIGWTTGAANVEAVYIGLALTATSIGISVQTLQQFGLIPHRVGQIVVAAAVIDDVLALFLLAAAHGVIGGEGEPSLWIAGVIGLAILTLGALFWAGRLAARLLRVRLPSGRSAYLTAAGMIIMLLAGWLTDALGFSAVVGGFFAAVGISEALEENEREKFSRQLEPFVWMFVPFFFVLIGTEARLDVITDPGMLTLLTALLLAAFAGKLIGGILGAFGCEPQARVLVGLCMVPRGEVTVVIAGLAFAQGHLSHHSFVTLIVVAVIAAIMAPLLMTPLARRCAGASR